jgi:MoxR-like ATPase
MTITHFENEHPKVDLLVRIEELIKQLKYLGHGQLDDEVIDRIREITGLKSDEP